jgi:hypothetical protein
MPQWVPSPSLDQAAALPGVKLAPAGTAGYEEQVARFAQRLWRLLAGSVTTGSAALEQGSRPVLSLFPSKFAESESVEDKQRLEAARAEWARSFSARVDTMRAMLSNNVASDSPTPVIADDE